jgi:chorismate mutase
MGERKPFRIPATEALIREKLFIAGPCSVESPEQIAQAAEALSGSVVDVLRGGIWKPRTRPGSFVGVGSRGLKWLREAGDAAGLAVATEAAEPRHVEACLRAGIDVIWIGARTTVNPFAVQAVCDCLRGVDIPVMVKNPMHPDIELWIGALERLDRAGVKNIATIHRGFWLSGKSMYRNVPLWRIPIELRRRAPSIPMICDPSHICGTRRLIPRIAQEAMDLLYSGLMIEVHPDPTCSLSDAQQQMTPAALKRLLGRLKIRVPAVENQALLGLIQGLRKEIDELDHGIVDLLARRMEKVDELAACKDAGNVSAFQPKRWERILKSRVREGVCRDLSRGFVTDIYERIHEEALHRQEKLLAGQTEKPRRDKGKGPP